MKHNFQAPYLIDAPQSLVVGAYLDCEHYYYLHDNAIQHCEILEYSPTHIRWNQVWRIFGFRIGHTLTTRYLPPATFINEKIMAFPQWLPSIHHFVKVESRSDFYHWDDKTTLSIFTVDMNLPWYIYPFRNILKYLILRFKILIDLEDVAMLARKTHVFGSQSVFHLLHKDQFILFKDEFSKNFGDLSNPLKPPLELQNKNYERITELKKSYIKKFMHTRFRELSGLR